MIIYTVVIICSAIAAGILIISNASTEGIFGGVILYALGIVIATILEFAADPPNDLKIFLEIVILILVVISMIFGLINGQYINEFSINL